MILYIKELRAGLGIYDFYKMLYTDDSYVARIKKIVYDILVRYGKIATKGNESIGNKNNMDISVSIDGGNLDVDFHWGKDKSEIARFNKKIRDMVHGTTEVPSVEELVDWVRGKQRFFTENPFMLKNGATFFDSNIVSNEREYAELLQKKLEETMVFSSGKDVFRGQSKEATPYNPIQPEYTNKSKDFLEVINEKVSNEFKKRFDGISERLIDRILARNAGSVEYIVAIDDGNNVNLLNVDRVSDFVVDYIRNEGMIVVEYEENNDIQKYYTETKDIASKIYNVSSSTYDKMTRSIDIDIKSNTKLDVNKYSNIIKSKLNKFNK